MVDYKKIEDVCQNIFAGGTPNTKQEEYYDGNIPWIRSGEVDFNVIRTAERNISELGYKNSSAKLIRKGSVVMAMTGATVAKSAIVEFETSANQSVCALETNEDVISYRFLYYVLAKNYFTIKSSAQGALTSLNLSMIKQIEIPVPTLNKQKEIVRILDSFTSMITNLETELASRQKQYEHYRNELLTFDDNDESVEWKTLGEIGTIVRGNGLQKTDFSEEGVGCVHYGQIYTRLGFSIEKTLTFVPGELAEKLTQVESGNLIIACTSENIEDVCKSVVWLGSENIVTGGHACVFKHNENPKYVGYCFMTNDFFNQKKKYAYGAKVIDIKTEKLALIKIPVPKRSLQDDIVEKLDTFESLITNIKQELDARKKQYEYYREQLLTFRPSPALP